MFKNPIVKDFWVIIILLCSSFLLLLSPVYVDAERPHVCPTIVHINKLLNVPFGCDSTEFLKLSRHPEALPLGSTYQSRPLYIILASLLGFPLLMLYKLGAFNSFGLEAWIGGISDTSLGLDTFLYVLPYFIMNFFFLGLAIFFFKKILSPKKWSFGVLALSLVLIINPVTKFNLFSVHSQMFNILLPAFLLYFSIKYFECDRLRNKQFYLGALFSGLSLLFYGSFIVIPFVFALLYLYKNKFSEFCENFWLAMKKFFIASLLFVFPYLIWIGISIAVGGRYENYEVKNFRQFVWMIDALKIGVSQLLFKMEVFFVKFFSVTAETIWPMLVLFLAFLLLYLVVKRKIGVMEKKVQARLVIIGVIFFCFILFFYLMGYYEARLSFNFVPLLLVLTGIFASEIKKINNKRIELLIDAPLLFFVVCWIWQIVSIPV